MGPKNLKAPNQTNLTQKISSKLQAALFIVAISYLIYNIYQATVTTIFLYHFSQLPPILIGFANSHSTLQLSLLLIQEIAGSAGIYLRLVAGLLALKFVWQIKNQNPNYTKTLSKILLLEGLHFLLLLPAGINHIVGSTLNPDMYLNLYTGISFLMQAIIIFPPLFILSRKLKQTNPTPTLSKWMGTSAVLYTFGIWIEHSFLWIYALQPLGAQTTTPIGTIGFINSWAPLLLAGITAIAAFQKYMQNNQVPQKLAGTSLLLVAFYFIIYIIVAIWIPIYLAFLPLTEIWLITTTFPAIILLTNQTIMSKN